MSRFSCSVLTLPRSQLPRGKRAPGSAFSCTGWSWRDGDDGHGPVLECGGETVQQEITQSGCSPVWLFPCLGVPLSGCSLFGMFAIRDVPYSGCSRHRSERISSAAPCSNLLSFFLKLTFCNANNSVIRAKVLLDLHGTHQNSVSRLKIKGDFTHSNLGLNPTREFQISTPLEVLRTMN